MRDVENEIDVSKNEILPGENVPANNIDCLNVYSSFPVWEVRSPTCSSSPLRCTSVTDSAVNKTVVLVRPCEIGFKWTDQDQHTDRFTERCVIDNRIFKEATMKDMRREYTLEMLSDETLCNKTSKYCSDKTCRNTRRTHFIESNLATKNTNNSSSGIPCKQHSKRFKNSSGISTVLANENCLSRRQAYESLSNPEQMSVPSNKVVHEDVGSLEEIPFYQVGRMLEFNREKAYKNKNITGTGQGSDFMDDKHDCKHKYHNCRRSVIRKMEPGDKSSFLCRPAVGSDDNFIEIRKKTAESGVVDELCPGKHYVGVGAVPNIKLPYTLRPYGSLNCIAPKYASYSLINCQPSTLSLRPHRLEENMFSSKSFTHSSYSRNDLGTSFIQRYLDSRRKRRLVDETLSNTLEYNKFPHSARYTHSHAGTRGDPLDSFSFRSTKSYNGWPSFISIPGSRSIYSTSMNRTNNATSSNSQVSSSSSSSSANIFLPDLTNAKVVPVRGDGRCLFRSLATILSKTLQECTYRDSNGCLDCEYCSAKEEKRADRLRAKVVRLMTDNLHFYSELGADIINADQPDDVCYQKFDDRLQDMSKTTAMPGEIELNAAAYVLKRAIVIVDEDLVVINIYGQDEFPLSEPAIVRFTRLSENTGHFDPVMPHCRHASEVNVHHNGHEQESYKTSEPKDPRMSYEPKECSCRKCHCYEQSERFADNENDNFNCPFNNKHLGRCRENQKTKQQASSRSRKRPKSRKVDRDDDSSYDLTSRRRVSSATSMTGDEESARNRGGYKVSSCACSICILETSSRDTSGNRDSLPMSRNNNKRQKKSPQEPAKPSQKVKKRAKKKSRKKAAPRRR
ncbi:uncharacterized protein LOC106060883 [Biomphalaria glabrata]|uniref:Uncharacterized protein LOC106060883 n=1 Tax=Biomphalaria glabrata TaxID=6526 RepID=A0A9W3B2A7_BIOGL|nr:uncharacterized protein LOC106060883 [Biomphalaria glabrata]